MYKIYINETPLFLTNKPLSELLIKKQPEILAGQYDGKVKTIFRYIDQCEKTDRFKEVWLTYPDIDKLFDDFINSFWFEFVFHQCIQMTCKISVQTFISRN